MMHLANINDKEYYHCHTLAKTEEILKQISQHVFISKYIEKHVKRSKNGIRNTTLIQSSDSI